MIFHFVMLFVFDFSETQGGRSCDNALNICMNIFDNILSIAGDINVSNHARTVPFFHTQFSLLTASSDMQIAVL